MWESSKDKLLCFMVLDDSFAPELSSTAGPAFWRAFIVQDRGTGEIRALWRFRYARGDRSWMEIKPRDQATIGKDAITAKLRCAMEDVIREAAKLLDHELPLEAIQAYYPPDDGGDPAKTLIWLEQRDLVEIVKVEGVEGGEKNARESNS